MLAGSTCYGFSFVNVDTVIQVIYKHEYEQQTESVGKKTKNRTDHLDIM